MEYISSGFKWTSVEMNPFTAFLVSRRKMRFWPSGFFWLLLLSVNEVIANHLRINGTLTGNLFLRESALNFLRLLFLALLLSSLFRVSARWQKCFKHSGVSLLNLTIFAFLPLTLHLPFALWGNLFSRYSPGFVFLQEIFILTLFYLALERVLAVYFPVSRAKARKIILTSIVLVVGIIFLCLIFFLPLLAASCLFFFFYPGG